MNDQTPVTFRLEHVPADKLSVAPENPRSDETVDFDLINDLAASIAENGLLTPLIGYQHGDRTLITAGGRRVRAITILDETMMFSGTSWPVHIMSRENAVHAGNAEQLSHVAMDEADELRLFTAQAYQFMTDAELGAALGRSRLYVAQRREILSLPDTMREAVLSRAISIEQGIGLTYARDYPGTQSDLFARALKDPRFGLEAMRNALSETVKPWSSFCHAQLVTHQDYREAGGRLQDDLFSDDPFVMDPHILLQVATEKARDDMKARYPNALFVLQGDDDKHLSDYRTHPGVYGLTDEEAQEYRDTLGWYALHQLEQAAQPDPETGEINEDAVAAHEAALARRAELEPRAVYSYPDDLAELLGVVWKLSQGAIRDYHGAMRTPLAIREHVIPDAPGDLEKLYERGYLKRPSDAASTAGDKSAEKPADKISNALGLNIERIRAHALRMELSRTPDLAIKMFTSHLAARVGRTNGFSVDPDNAFHPDPELGVTFTKQWERMVELAALDPAAVMEEADKTVREVLAYRILMCLTTKHSLCAKQDAATIRKYWTPPANFLRSYSKAQLAQMAHDLKPDEDFSTQKRDGLAEIAATLGGKKKDWLPLGF